MFLKFWNACYHSYEFEKKVMMKFSGYRLPATSGDLDNIARLTHTWISSGLNKNWTSTKPLFDQSTFVIDQVSLFWIRSPTKMINIPFSGYRCHIESEANKSRTANFNRAFYRKIANSIIYTEFVCLTFNMAAITRKRSIIIDPW